MWGKMMIRSKVSRREPFWLPRRGVDAQWHPFCLGQHEDLAPSDSVGDQLRCDVSSGVVPYGRQGPRVGGGWHRAQRGIRASDVYSFSSKFDDLVDFTYDAFIRVSDRVHQVEVEERSMTSKGSSGVKGTGYKYLSG